jgi:uncharacterized protein (TIGR02246 family)
MGRKRLGSNLAACLAVFIALLTSVKAEDADQAIRSQLDIFEQAFNSGDGAKIGALYTEDATVFPPGSPRVEGREAIGKLWQSMIDSGARDLDIEVLEINAQNGTAYDIGRVNFATQNGRAEGTYIDIWLRGGDGDWRIHRDIWNMNSQ